MGGVATKSGTKSNGKLIDTHSNNKTNNKHDHSTTNKNGSRSKYQGVNNNNYMNIYHIKN